MPAVPTARDWPIPRGRRLALETRDIPDLVQAVLLAIAAVAIGAFVVVALFRLTYPFPLQITEAPTLRELERVLHGQPNYVAPTLQHVPLVYGPLYVYVAAFVALLTGPTYAALRAVSLLASIGPLASLYALVRRETDSR